MDTIQNLAGKEIGGYKLGNLIGDKSAQGAVYEAKSGDTDVVVKTRRVDPGSPESERFEIEIELHMSLDHPNILQVLDSGYDENNSVSYSVSKRLKGYSLGKRFKKKRKFSLPEIIHIFVNLVGALGHAHLRRIYHQDLKPANIMVECEEKEPIINKPVWLIDFGLGVWGQPRGTNARHPAFGSPYYQAPEQIKNLTPNHQTDIWQLSVVLYRMLTGKLPFYHHDKIQAQRDMLDKPAQAPSFHKPSLGQWDQFFVRGLAKDRRRRFKAVDKMFNHFMECVPKDLRCSTDKIPRGPDLPPLRSVKTRDKVEIVFTEKGTGEPLIFLPPWISNQGYLWAYVPLRKFFEGLAKGCRLITYDKRGCGFSSRDPNDVTFDAQLRDLNTLIDHLELKRFAIMAMSAGGPLALSYTVDHPDRVSKLILYGTYADGTGIITESEKQAQKALIEAYWRKRQAAKFFADLFMGGNRQSNAMFDWLVLYQIRSSSAKHAAIFLSQVYETNVRDQAMRVQRPTLILHRQGDKAIPYKMGEELKSLIPNARLVTLEGNIHLPWLGSDQERIRDEILNFLRES